jgi:hypothetical protein
LYFRNVDWDYDYPADLQGIDGGWFYRPNVRDLLTWRIRIELNLKVKVGLVKRFPNMQKEMIRSDGQFVQAGDRWYWKSAPNPFLFKITTFYQKVSVKKPGIEDAWKHQENSDPVDVDTPLVEVLNFEELAAKTRKQLESTGWYGGDPDEPGYNLRPLTFTDAVENLRRRRVPKSLRIRSGKCITPVSGKKHWSCPSAFKDRNTRLQFMQWKSGYAKIISYHTTDGDEKSYLL